MNAKNLGLISSHTGQIVITDPTRITSTWSERSAPGVSLWGKDAAELISALAEETSFQIDKFNNWYRVIGDVTADQIQDLATAAMLDVYVEALRGDYMFEQLRNMNESEKAGGSYEESAITAFVDLGMYAVHVEDQNISIGKKDVSLLQKDDLGTVTTSGILLMCDPANIRLHDFEAQGDDNILPHIHDLTAHSSGGQLTFSGHTTQEFFVAVKAESGRYHAEGYYDLDDQGFRTYRSIILRKSK